MKPSAEIIREVLDLLDSEEKWCKFAQARDELGFTVAGEWPTAVKWCLGGAICHVTRTPWVILMCGGTMNFLNRRACEDGWDNFVDFNNSSSTSFEDLRLFLKKALIEAEEME